MDDSLKHRLTHPIEIYPVASRDSYGDITFGEPVETMAYKYGKITRVISLEGEEVVSSLHLIVDGIYYFTAGSYIMHAERKYPIKAFEAFDGLEPGTGTTVIYV